MRVLAADDDPPMQRLLQRTLTSWGYDVQIARSGLEAWHALKVDGAPPIAVLDWDMPGLTGIEVCRLLRSTPHGARTYVLILTGKQQKRDLIEALEAGADDFLSKPFDARELQLRLAKGVRDRRVLPDATGPTPVAAGATVGGKFRLERVLAEGGMGTIWLGVHLALGVNVAVKLMHRHLGSDPDFVSFDREARAAAQLRNAHVVRMFDHGIAAGGVPYLVMEYVSGESLGARVGRVGALAAARVDAIVQQTAEALADAHAHGILHRDVKPDNILLTEESEGDEPFVKLVDFGLALRTEAARQEGGIVAGTPSYMSPEYLAGGVADPLLDLWGLACSAFEAMTGREPFHGDSAGDIYRRVRLSPLPVPSASAPSIPPGFDAWFARACARDPAQRFQTAPELASSLHAAIA